MSKVRDALCGVSLAGMLLLGVAVQAGHIQSPTSQSEPGKQSEKKAVQSVSGKVSAIGSGGRAETFFVIGSYVAGTGAPSMSAVACVIGPFSATEAVSVGVRVAIHEPSAGLGALSAGGEATVKLHARVSLVPETLVRRTLTVCVPSERPLRCTHAVPRV